MTTPAELRTEALAILSEIPHAFVQLANGDHRSRREFFLTSIRTTHREIAESFGEPRPSNIGVTTISDDLTRWVSLWTWHPSGSRWVADLRHHLHIANEGAPVTHPLRWIDKGDAVCPTCLSLGCLSYQEASWDHWCSVTRQGWTWSAYRAAVKVAVATAKERAA